MTFEAAVLKMLAGMRCAKDIFVVLTREGFAVEEKKKVYEEPKLEKVQRLIEVTEGTNNVISPAIT